MYRLMFPVLLFMWLALIWIFEMDISMSLITLCCATAIAMVLPRETGWLDRLMGARSISMDLEKIDFAEIRGLSKFLYIQYKDNTYRFSGSGAHRIYERLEIQRRAFMSGCETPDNFKEYQERVLLQGDIDIYIRGNWCTSGNLILTNRRIRIETIPGLDTLLFRHKKLEAWNQDITSFKFMLYQGKLTITTMDDKISVGGATNGMCTRA